MASLWKHPNSSFWTACFTDELGRQRKRTTKMKDRRDAMKVAESFEHATRLAGAGELTRATATKLLNELMERTTGEGLDTRSTRQHLADYFASLEARGTKTGTLNRYSPIFEGFLAHLGEARSKARLASITGLEIETFHAAELRAGKSASTAAFAIKVLNAAFEDAKRKASILHNPLPDVLKRLGRSARAESEERHPFTDPQVQLLLTVADTEWQGMILLAYHTGIRLSDAANLTWQNIENGKLLRFRDEKTSHRKRSSERETVVVLPHDLSEYLRSLPQPKKKDAPLFPSLHGKKSGSAGGLSNAFSRLMDKAGIDREQGEERKGKGRRFSALSFHSLRHTMISRLANSDTPEAVTKAMSGHSTDEAHRRYVHLDTAAQEKVMAKAPRLWRANAA